MDVTYGLFEDEAIPLPSYRHAMPSGPWPWTDVGVRESPQKTPPPTCHHENCSSDCAKWLDYPRSLFPNWTAELVHRSRMLIRAELQSQCHMYYIDINSDREFAHPLEISVLKGQEKDVWDFFNADRPQNLYARAIFLENITSPILRIIGTKYNIEPFFFSSSLNWIPSRFQEDVQKGKGDHITVTLTFLRSIPSSTTRRQRGNTEVIDTQAPLLLKSGIKDRELTLDTLAIHMIRRATDSTIISYHPNQKGDANPRRGLHARFHLIGSSVYWRKIFSRSQDITFLFLAILWHAVYAWDEALESLYIHISHLEKQVIETNDIHITRELHVIRAHLLHYDSLLDDLRKSIEFVRESRNPALELPKKERELLEWEADNLLLEVKRLRTSRVNQDMRLKNVINLVFSLVNLEDSKRSQKLTEISLRDSEATKQLSYLTMIFFPAIFVSGVFSMNVKEINPYSHGHLSTFFIVTAVASVITSWTLIALLSGRLTGEGFWVRVFWPYSLGRRAFLGWSKRRGL